MLSGPEFLSDCCLRARAAPLGGQEGLEQWLIGLTTTMRQAHFVN